jgi:hypothetical protein
MSNPTQMPRPKSAPPIPEVQPPKCPHCKAELGSIEKFNWGSPTWVILCVMCPACHVALAFEFLAVQKAGADPGEPPPGGYIHVPS